MNTENLNTNSLSAQNVYENELKSWIEEEKAAIVLISIVGKLWLDKSVELVIFRNRLIDRSGSEMLNLHLYAKNIVKKPINIYDTVAIASEMLNMELAPSRIDIGRLGAEWLMEKNSFKDVADFLSVKLAKYTDASKFSLKPKDVILYGFGRIGRLVARELVSQSGKGEQLRLRAIVARYKNEVEFIKRADLLRNDSVHGPFSGTIVEDYEKGTLNINGHLVQIISAGEPDKIDYEKYGIQDALLIDNTGISRDREGLSKHLLSKGVGKVLLTAPGKGDIPNIVHGINHNEYTKDDRIFSAASCTTNAIVPILTVVDRALGIEHGHIETIHSYTNDQNLLDNFHSKYRRGRSAALNMVITETGADKAVAKVLPQLTGKLTGNAVRVPTPDVSLAILNLGVSKETTKEDVNEILREAALSGNLVEQIQYSFSNELVSTDVIGNPCACVFDSPATIVSKNKKHVVLYVWYDNEYGYSLQVVRFAKHLSEVIRLRYY